MVGNGEIDMEKKSRLGGKYFGRYGSVLLKICNRYIF